MLQRLLIIFILVPFIELIILIQVGRYLGFWPTVLLLVALGLFGVVLVRTQGLYAWHRIRAEIAVGRLPGEALLDGLLVLSAGLLLITPGLLTDAAGLLLLLPKVRAFARLNLSGWLLRLMGSRLHLKLFRYR